MIFSSKKIKNKFSFYHLLFKKQGKLETASLSIHLVKFSKIEVDRQETSAASPDTGEFIWGS